MQFNFYRRPIAYFSASLAIPPLFFFTDHDGRSIGTRIGDSKDMLDLSARYSRVFSTIGMIIAEYKFAELLTYNRSLPLETGYWSLSKVHQRSATRILSLCQKNGGVFIKIGQHLSTLDYLLPKEYCQILKCLQDKAPQTPIEEVHGVICKSLNLNSVDDFFSSFDPNPIGVASLAQVHKAVIKSTSETVAVKVQHPLVERFAPLDIHAVSIFTGTVKRLFPSFTLQWLAEEISENLPKEIDFINEASNAIKTRAIVEDINSRKTIFSWLFGSSKSEIELIVPCPLLAFCTTKVLIMEYIDDFGVSLENSPIKSHALNVINRFFSDMIFKYGWVHCDPHPGNFKIVPPLHPDSHYKLAILDHGLYRQLSDELRQSYAMLWLSLIEGNEKNLVSCLKNLCPNCDNDNLPKQLVFLTNDGSKAHRLLSSVLSRRTWRSLELGVSSSSSLTMTVARPPIKITPERLGLITFMFEVIQRDLLLILKANDLLVSLNFLLSDPLNTRDPLIKYFSTVGLVCAQALVPSFTDFHTKWSPLLWICFIQRYSLYYYRLFKYQLLYYACS